MIKKKKKKRKIKIFTIHIKLIIQMMKKNMKVEKVQFHQKRNMKQ